MLYTQFSGDSPVKQGIKIGIACCIPIGVSDY